jgi:multimeric flavodoxin WrbA
MAKILALVGSARKWGNAEVLAREALLGAQEAGASIALVRLPELHIEPCDGCLKCALGRGTCPLDDDLAWLLEQVQASDALLLTAPTYFLGPAATVKLVIDRLLMRASTLAAQAAAPAAENRPGEGSEPAPGLRKVGAAIAVCGVQEWRGVTLSFLVSLVQGLGFPPLDGFYAYAPGPGEVLLDEALMARVHHLGQRLALGRVERLSPDEENVCPTCRGDAFVLRGDVAICPICGQEAWVAVPDGHVRLAFAAEEGGRWSEQGLAEFLNDWVIPSAGRFLEHRQEIKARRQHLETMEVPWLRPGG